MSPAPNHQTFTILGEIPVWVAIVAVILFILIVTLLYDPHREVVGR